MVAAGCGGGRLRRASLVDQEPPGRTPRIFAPGVVSKGNIHGRIAVSPDGRSILWNTYDSASGSTRILWTRKFGRRWTDPESPPFAAGLNAASPMFSPDGGKLFFMVATSKGWATKYVEMTPAGWSAPREDGVLLDCSSSFTRSGRAFFSAPMDGKVWGTGIYSARHSAEGLSDPRPLDGSINVPNAIDYTPFVSPDGSFLLFSSNRPLTGDGEDMHIYVTFDLGGGKWSAPRRLFEIQARFPSISPDGRVIFFCGDDGNVYWVDARVVESFRPDSEGRRAGR